MKEKLYKKHFPVFVNLKGKTKGRPSEFELNASKMISAEFDKRKDDIQEAINSAMLFGTSVIKI